MLRTLGGRLTALATGITLIVSLVVCTVLYVGIRRSLFHEVDAFLAGEVMEFRAMLSASGGDLDDVQRRIRAELGSRQRGDLTFRLLDLDGRVLLTSEPHNDGLPNPWPTPPRPSTNLYVRTESGSTAADHTRTCSQWVAFPDGSSRIVQATYLLDQVLASLARFQKTCIGALAAAVVLAAFGGRILAARSLRPVGNMASAARKISVEHLGERLDRTATGDELDQLAETFNDMFERLERQVARLRQFTADAAHELRTPLAALRGNAEVALSEKRSPSELRAVIAESIDEYDRLARIADDLLLLARSDAGQDFIRREPLRLDKALRDVADLYSPTAEERGIDLSCAAACSVWITGDDGRLRQMIGNLVDNALKHTPPGGHVDLELVTVNGTAEINVRDTGEGIGQEHLSHVFDRFYRANHARTRGGAGLGLSICKTIAEAHAGSISLASERTGTCVCVRMPIHTNSELLLQPSYFKDAC